MEKSLNANSPNQHFIISALEDETQKNLPHFQVLQGHWEPKEMLEKGKVFSLGKPNTALVANFQFNKNPLKPMQQ